MTSIGQYFKNGLKQIFRSLGYALYHESQLRDDLARNYVSRSMYNNLALAYELRLKESLGIDIKRNDLRFSLLSRLEGTPPSEAYFLIESLEKTRRVSGDVCEFGVAQGKTSALIANEINAIVDKKLHLFDSFEGLPAPTARDELKDDIFGLGSMAAYAGTMKCPEDMVLAALRAIAFPPERYIIHKGFIEELIKVDATLPAQVSFAYVDFDFYEPIKIALEFLHTVTAAGAIIIVDDYDFFSTGVKHAVDEFLQTRNANEKIYELFIPDKLYGCFAILTKL